MFWRILSLACCLGASGSALADEKPTSELPVRVTVCELENHAVVCDRKVVEVSGRIYVGKSNFYAYGNNPIFWADSDRACS